MSAALFDLKEYVLVADTAFPYLPQPVLINNHYNIYEGAIGKNRYQFFTIPLNSKAGILCTSFIEKYFVTKEYYHEYYEDGQTLIAACEIDAIQKLNGLPAFLKYWNDCKTIDDKLRLDFAIIPHFAALKEWFDLKLVKFIQKNESQYLLSESVKEADIRQFKEDNATRVYKFLKANERSGKGVLGTVTKLHAEEMIKFYKWLTDQPVESIHQPRGQNKTEDTAVEIKPVIRSDAVPTLVEIIKDFFSGDQEVELRQLLVKGISPNSKLFFLSNANKLADTFKQLFDAKLIAGCSKKELEIWIAKNFSSQFRGKKKDYSIRHLHNVISSPHNRCSNPIIDVIKNNFTGEYKIKKHQD